MRIEIHSRHMEHSEALDSLTEQKFKNAVEKRLHHHDAHLLVWLISDRNLLNRGSGAFCCEVELRYPPRKNIFITKKASDIHIAIQEAADSLKVLIDDSGKKQFKGRNSTRAAAL